MQAAVTQYLALLPQLVVAVHLRPVVILVVLVLEYITEALVDKESLGKAIRLVIRQ
jgi:hypothetical protein